MVAISEVTKEVIRGQSSLLSRREMDYAWFLVISIGTGTFKDDEKYNAHEAAKWGIFCWLNSNGSTPIVDVFSQSNADMVNLHLSVVFQALHSEKSYL